nr:hypothetical protein [Pseudomonas fuscovaginae]
MHRRPQAQSWAGGQIEPLRHLSEKSAQALSASYGEPARHAMCTAQAWLRADRPA